MNRFCDLEECTNSCDVLACGHAYHHECFLLQLGSQCQYCTAYLVSGIEYNCRIFQQTVSSFDVSTVTDECADDNELNVEVDDSNTGDEDFASRALNTLTSA